MSLINLRFPHRAIGVPYNLAIGQGVDAYGRTALPLDIAGGDKPIKIGSGGSDGSLNPSTHTGRLASLTEAFNRFASGHGDHILIPDGDSLAQAIPWLAFKNGKDAAHPMVFQSYDPADENNQAKWGNGHLRGGRPVLTSPQGQIYSGTAGKFMAIRGLDFNPGNVSGANFGWAGNAVPDADFILFENLVLRYTSINMDFASSTTNKTFIMRGCSRYGPWSGFGGFFDHVSPTYEDCVMWHDGWKIGASRDADYTVGGLGPGSQGVFFHTNYVTPGAGPGNSQITLRRCLIADGPGDSGTYRGSVDFDDNVVFDCPVNAYLGGGDSISVKAPLGVMLKCRRNALVGSQGVTSWNQLGWGIVLQNGQNGSEAYNNLLARGNPNQSNAVAFSVGILDPTMDAWGSFHHNVADGWTNPAFGPAFYIYAGSDPSKQHASYNYNYWDDPASGTNLNISSLVRPNRYTPDSLAAANGFADKIAMLQYMSDHPEAMLQRSLKTQLFTGYGCPW